MSHEDGRGAYFCDWTLKKETKMKTIVRMIVAWNSVRSRPRFVRKTEPPDIPPRAAPKPEPFTWSRTQPMRRAEMMIWTMLRSMFELPDGEHGSLGGLPRRSCDDGVSLIVEPKNRSGEFLGIVAVTVLFRHHVCFDESDSGPGLH